MSTLQRVRDRSVPASELESLGKTAARLSDTSGISLTEAAVRTLEPQGLNAEQIRRVVEQTNIAAVNHKFASLSGRNRIVHIDGGPADPITVIDALHASTSAPGARLMALEYAVGPDHYKVASYTPVLAERDEDIPDFGTKLAAAHDELVDMCSGLEFRMEMQLDELCQRAKQAGRDGASLTDLALAWSRVDPLLVHAATSQLQGEIQVGVKTASRRISPEHPVVEAYREFSKVAREYQRAADARRNVEFKLAEVTSFLRTHMS